MNEDALLHAPPLRGRYRLLRVLGEGSVARTYLARDEETGGQVAVKVLFPSRVASVNDFERFQRESAALASLDHAGIPRYIDHFEGDDRTFCLVQEFVDGESLEQARARGAFRGRSELIELAAALLRIIVHLSEREPPVVHRDIKPANILITPTGGVRLVDFGGVREAVRETIRAGSTVIGTYGFMPPEQLVGRAVPASDLFAVGITLVSLYTGRPAELLSSDGFTVDLNELDLPPDDLFRRFVAGLVEVHLDDRYQSPRDALEDCEGLIHGRAPRFADRIARRAEERRAIERRQARRRLLAGRWTLLTILFLVMGVAFFGLLATLHAAISGMKADEGRILAFIASLLPLIYVVRLLVARYSREEWTPPDPSWRVAIGEVRDVMIQYGNGNQGWGAQLVVSLDGEELHLPVPGRQVQRSRQGERYRVHYLDQGRRGLEVERYPVDLPDERIPIRRLT